MSCIRSDSSRCARLRSDSSACGRCVASCPQEAISVMDSILIDRTACLECGCCAAVCPNGALHWDAPMGFGRMVARVGRRKESVIGCDRSALATHLDAGACLGWLAEEHLCALTVSAKQGVQLDLTQCGQCPGGYVAEILRSRIASATQGTGLPVSERVQLVKDPEELWRNADGVGRRQFLKIWKEFAMAEPEGFPHVEFCAHVQRDEVLPPMREIVEWVAAQCGDDVRQRIERHFSGQVQILDNCEGCGACDAVCPTGALDEQEDGEKPVFLPSRCTECGACEAFCSESAILVNPNRNPLSKERHQ